MSGYPEKVRRLRVDDTGRWLAADGVPDVTVLDFGGKGPEGTAPRSLQAHDTITALAWRLEFAAEVAGLVWSGQHPLVVADRSGRVDLIELPNQS